MKRRTKADWQALVDAHAASGQTATAFCRAHGLNSTYFSSRRRALCETQARSSAKLSPVSLPSGLSRSDIRLEYAGGVVLRLPSSAEPMWFARLLRALRD